MGRVFSRIPWQRAWLWHWNGKSCTTPSESHLNPFFQESMSSTELSSHQTRASSCTFCVEDFHHTSSEAKRLETLCTDVQRLQTEKHDLLRQNVSCKTDIKKLKDRYRALKVVLKFTWNFCRQSYLSDELERANDEISRLRRMLKKPSNSDMAPVHQHFERSYSDVSVWRFSSWNLSKTLVSYFPFYQGTIHFGLLCKTLFSNDVIYIFYEFSKSF